MRNRRQKLAELPPNPARISEYLADAQVTAADLRRDGAAALARRAKAVRALHAIWLKWKAATLSTGNLPLADYADDALRQLHQHWIGELGAPADFDRALRDFFDRAGRVLFASPDPLTAMRVLWEGPPRRGRRAEDNAERDYRLAMAVQERVDDGASIEAASAAVGEAGRPYLSGEAVRKAYNRWRLEVRAERELRTIWNIGR
jgi:hypothetical protein